MAWDDGRGCRPRLHGADDAHPGKPPAGLPGEGRRTGDGDFAAMFSRIAPRYDLVNRLISAGLDRSWRRALMRRLPAGRPPRRILDVCCGTGALLELLAGRYPAARVVGLDFAPGMLHVAERRLERTGIPRPALVRGDQHDLPFADGSFDLVTNAFGLRNADDYRRSLAEMRRVLAPGGVLAILEITPPGGNLFGRLFYLYFDWLAPLIARCLGGNHEAYRYLPASVHAFQTGSALTEEVGAVMGARATLHPLFGQAVSLITARREV